MQSVQSSRTLSPVQVLPIDRIDQTRGSTDVQGECVICLDAIQGWRVRTVCACSRALFCTECWHRWIECGKQKCPLCRTVIQTYCTENMATGQRQESIVEIEQPGGCESSHVSKWRICAVGLVSAMVCVTLAGGSSVQYGMWSWLVAAIHMGMQTAQTVWKIIVLLDEERFRGSAQFRAVSHLYWFGTIYLGAAVIVCFITSLAANMLMGLVAFVGVEWLVLLGVTIVSSLV